MNDVSIHTFQHDDIGFVTAMGVSGGVRRPFWDKGISHTGLLQAEGVNALSLSYLYYIILQNQMCSNVYYFNCHVIRNMFMVCQLQNVCSVQKSAGPPA